VKNSVIKGNRIGEIERNAGKRETRRRGSSTSVAAAVVVVLAMPLFGWYGQEGGGRRDTRG
jgi:hypothetical protein